MSSTTYGNCSACGQECQHSATTCPICGSPLPWAVVTQAVPPTQFRIGGSVIRTTSLVTFGQKVNWWFGFLCSLFKSVFGWFAIPVAFTLLLLAFNNPAFVIGVIGALAVLGTPLGKDYMGYKAFIALVILLTGAYFNGFFVYTPSN